MPRPPLPPQTAALRPARPGFTITELVISLVVMAILMGGMTSAIVLSTRALPADDASAATTRTSAVLDRMAAELSSALRIFERTATTISFSVPDRDGDSRPERIRYAWSGVAGDPLTRQQDAGPASEVLTNVHAFAPTFITGQYTFACRAQSVEDATATTFAAKTTAKNGLNYPVGDNDWIGQYFEPALPGDAVAYRVSQVDVNARTENASASTALIELRPATRVLMPDARVVAQAALPHTALTSTAAWKSLALADPGGWDPSHGVCIVVRHGSGAPKALSIALDQTAGSGLLLTGSAGGSWVFYRTGSTAFRAYGYVTRPGAVRKLYYGYARSADVTIQVGADSAAWVQTSVPLWNAPSFLSAAWQLDFDVDPTTLDEDCDGAADWRRSDGQPFTKGALVDGVWQLDAALEAVTTCKFQDIARVELQLRTVGSAGAGAAYSMDLNISGGQACPLTVVTALEVDGSQTLEVSTPLRTISRSVGLDCGMIRLSLLFDPGTNTVCIGVNGVHRGTFALDRVVLGRAERPPTLYSAGAPAEFESVDILLGGAW